MLGMRLSARADYALRAAVELAASSGDHTTAEQLARAQNIPAKFLEAILTQLRRAGLVRSQRGPEGGFWLAKPANAISLADIIRAVDGQLVGVRGERKKRVVGDRVHPRFPQRGIERGAHLPGAHGRRHMPDAGAQARKCDRAHHAGNRTPLALARPERRAPCAPCGPRSPRASARWPA